MHEEQEENLPQSRRGTEGAQARRPRSEQERFGGVAVRRARLDSDGSTNNESPVVFVDPSDPVALAGPQCGPAAEPIASVSRCLCGNVVFFVTS